MRTTVASLLLVGSMLAAAAWFVQAPKEAQAVAVPEKYRETIRKGLDYLAGKQFKDGHWEGDGGAHPVAMTGLAGLALLMESEDPDRDVLRLRKESAAAKPNAEQHWPNIRKAADWLMAQTQPNRDGLLFSNHASETTRYMQGHGLATIFLAGVCEIETDADRRKKLTDALSRAVKYIASAQSTQGGWHDTSRAEGHDFATILATVIQVQALEAAENAGVSTPLGVVNDGLIYLKKALDKGVGLTDTAARLCPCLSRPTIDQGAATSQSAYVVQQKWFEQKWFDDCRKRIPVGKELTFGHDELAHYYFAQAERHFGGDFWATYETKLFDRLRDAQKDDGSWPAAEGACAGPVYATAVWCTILQLDNESHPSRQRIMHLID